MRFFSRIAGALALLATFAAAPAFGLTPDDGLVKIPPVARVTDLTGTLTAAQKNTLEQTLAEFERRKGSQIVVFMLPSTKPEEIAQFGIRVAEQWKPGRKGIDDGMILIVAKNDHRVRIEVGRGLEGVVPDIIASRVIREIVAPHFLNGDFYGGIDEGVERLIGLVDGEKLPPPPPSARRTHSSGGSDWNAILSIGFLLIFVVGGFLVRILGRVAGSGAVGIIAAVVAWIALGLAAAAIAGIIAFVAALLFGGGFGGPGRGGWGYGGGGFSGGGFGGGGFSGGGGDFGGGGASGSW